jgi:hypothetical protein
LVNASLNWASIVGIVLAVGGALLYFLRSFKPALARDYDVFFAAVGLLCGGILFFQGWRLDPILQFGQFLLAATTVFFAYESVRLRGVTTEQARRSAYFDEEEPAPFRPRGGLGGSRSWESDVDRFEEPEGFRRRIPSRDEVPEEDFYRPRRSSRAAIPERAVSRRVDPEDWEGPAGEPPAPRRPDSPRYTAGGASRSQPEFGSRRRERDSGPDLRRGSRPAAGAETMPRSSRRSPAVSTTRRPSAGPSGTAAARPADGVPRGEPLRSSRSKGPSDVSDADYSPIDTPPAAPPRSGGTSPRDNSSRFDD